MYILHKTADIVAIATQGSSNTKTGPMIQVWIMSNRLHPVESRRTGEDSTNQCRGCPYASNQGCYVAPLPLMSIWRAFQAGEYQPLELGSSEWITFFQGSSVRLGAYGNPSALPLPMLESICSLARMHTGYFHDWHLMPSQKAKSYGRYLMASVEPNNVAKARKLGLRTFQVVKEPSSSGIECLFDSHGVQCIDCRLCDGTKRSSKRSKPLPSVWIRVHGYQAKKAERVL